MTSRQGSRPSRPAARVVGVALVLLASAACGSAPAATPDPAALPVDFAVVWDLPGSTGEGGHGSYFDGSNPRLLRPGPVLVAWWCDGSGTLSVVPGRVARPPELPSPASPLAFQARCPTGGAAYVGWRQLAVPAVGGENVVDVNPAASPSAAIHYRIIFAQQAP